MWWLCGDQWMTDPRPAWKHNPVSQPGISKHFFPVSNYVRKYVYIVLSPHLSTFPLYFPLILTTDTEQVHQLKKTNKNNIMLVLGFDENEAKPNTIKHHIIYKIHGHSCHSNHSRNWLKNEILGHIIIFLIANNIDKHVSFESFWLQNGDKIKKPL